MEDDVNNVVKVAEEMFELCQKRRGMYPKAFAIAHPQVDDTDPMRFFVWNDEIVINPVIVRYTNTKMKKSEGCMSFPNIPPVSVDRFQKIEVEIQKVSPIGELTDPELYSFSGTEAQIVQHEIDHFDAIYVLPKEIIDRINDTAQDISASNGEVRGEVPTSEVPHNGG